MLESHWGQYAAAREFAEPGSAARASALPASIERRPPLEQPQPGDTVAKLIIPRLNAELYVVEGDDAADLRRGPGHLEGTAMPGDPGNCVIAGHRDTHFRVLRQIRRGDSVILESHRGRFVYRVRSMEVVSPEDTDSLQPSSSPVLHLITCYPFYYVGAAPRRMIVEAQLSSR